MMVFGKRQLIWSMKPFSIAELSASLKAISMGEKDHSNIPHRVTAGI